MRSTVARSHHSAVDLYRTNTLILIGNRGDAPPVSSSASDWLHRIRVAGLDGHPPGITSAGSDTAWPH